MNALDTRRWIELEKLRLIIANLNVTLALSFAAGCLLVIVLREVQSDLLAGLWVSVTLLISVMRYLHAREFRHTPEEAIDLRLWRFRVDFGTAVSGIWWGCGAVILFPADLPHQVYIAFILAGLGAAAMTSYAALRRTYFWFLLPSIVPLMVRIAVEGTHVHISMALLVGMFLIVVARSAINTERMISTVLKLRAENLELTRALHHEATHDALVDLVNHREFQTRLQAEAAASCADKHPYALLFVDLDHFKQINDTAGHAAGDEALRRVAAVLKAELRASDTAARVGGDEFAVLLPRCPRERARAVAENILAAIRKLEFSAGGRTLRLGASIGVAYTDAGEHDAPTTLRAADAACYEAKRSGRNRIEMHHSDPGYQVSGRFQLEGIDPERQQR
jgi:diguanylate cyclase (GGDEF)-like protein